MSPIEMAGVRPMVDAGTAHLRFGVDDKLLDTLADCPTRSEGAPRIVRHAYGWTLFLSGEPDTQQEEVQALNHAGARCGLTEALHYAHRAQAYILNLDADADPLPDVPTDREIDVVDAVASRFDLPPRVVITVLREPSARMRARDGYLEPQNCREPVTDYPRYEPHTPRITGHSDVNEAYLDYIEIIVPSQVIPREAEGAIRQHPTYARYVKWYRAGYLPPYPSVSEQRRDGKTKWLGANRRRILAAQEAGVRELPVWLGRWNTETNSPLKYSDILKAAAQAG